MLGLTGGTSARIRLATKINDEYKDFKVLPAALAAQQGPVGPARPPGQAREAITAGRTSFPFLKFNPLSLIYTLLQPALLPLLLYLLPNLVSFVPLTIPPLRNPPPSNLPTDYHRLFSCIRLLAPLNRRIMPTGS
jgi:hypothetical protein